MILWFLFVAGPLVLVLPEVGCPATPTVSRSSSINSQGGASTSGAPGEPEEPIGEGPPIVFTDLPDTVASPESYSRAFVLGYVRRNPDPCEALHVSEYEEEKTAVRNYCRDAGEAYLNMSAEMKEPCRRAVSASCERVRGYHPQNLHYQCTITSPRESSSLFSLGCVTAAKKNSLKYCASAAMGRPRDTWIRGEPRHHRPRPQGPPVQLNPFRIL